MSPACISLLFDEKLRLVRMFPTLKQFSSDHECAFRNETVVVSGFGAVRLNEFPNIHFRQNKRWIFFLHRSTVSILSLMKFYAATLTL